MSIDCLLDTNSIVKYYHNELGSNIVQYIFDKSLCININILNLHVAEVMSTFYKLRVKNILKSNEQRDKLIATFLLDIRNNKIKVYDFRTEHLKDTERVLQKVYTIPPPVKSKRKYIPFLGGFITELKDFADVMDSLLLVAMCEIQYLIGESYLFTSDGHVLEVAKSLNLATINPETTSINCLPPSLDRRRGKRNSVEVKAVCLDSETALNLGSTRTVDLCESGVCLAALNSNVEIGKLINLKLSSFNNPTRNIEVQGDIIWKDERGLGIRFLQSISLSSLN